MLNHVTSATHPHPALLPPGQWLYCTICQVSPGVVLNPSFFPTSNLSLSPVGFSSEMSPQSFPSLLSRLGPHHFSASASGLILSDVDSTQATTHFSRTHIRWSHAQPKPSEGSFNCFHNLAMTDPISYTALLPDAPAPQPPKLTLFAGLSYSLQFLDTCLMPSLLCPWKSYRHFKS